DVVRNLVSGVKNFAGWQAFHSYRFGDPLVYDQTVGARIDQANQLRPYRICADRSARSVLWIIDYCDGDDRQVARRDGAGKRSNKLATNDDLLNHRRPALLGFGDLQGGDEGKHHTRK